MTLLRKSGRFLWPFLKLLAPPPLKHTIPNLAAHFSRSLLLQNYVPEVVLNICLGINKPHTQKRSLGGILLTDFLRDLFFFFPHCTSWKRGCPFVLHLAPAGYQAVYWRRFADE